MAAQSESETSLNDPPLNDTPLSDTALEEAWARLRGLFFSRRDALFAELQVLHLTPAHGHALISLLHAGPTRMRDMAMSMACDASYVTAVADRLDELGLAERRNAADDRRARELVLTPEGERVARRLDGIFAEPHESLRNLSSADRAELIRIVRQLGPTVDADWMPAKTARS